MKIQEAATIYRGQGLPVIPINPRNKKPLIPWSEFQNRVPSSAEFEDWLQKWPDLMIGGVTGEKSGILVIDCDTEEAYQKIQEYLPENLLTPISKTPRGHHLYFKYPEDSCLTVGANVLPGVDFRGQGGFIICPPSRNGSKIGYSWLPGLDIFNVRPAEVPEGVLEILKASNTSEHSRAQGYNKVYSLYNDKIHSRGIGESDDNAEKMFREGRRDESLFHIAHCLFKGGCQEHEVKQVIDILARNCDPPFPEKEINAKILSALKRSDRREKALSDEVRDFILSTSGHFLSTDVHKNLDLSTRVHKKNCSEILRRLIDEGLIERYGNKNGCFRKIENEVEEMDFVNAQTETVDLWLPFNLHNHVKIMPGNIILLAGAPNAGKTGLLLNIIQANQKKFETHYFNSEMGASELKLRLSLFQDVSLDMWKFKAWERSSNFADVVRPGKGKLNIIDFLEIYENFYEIGGRLAEIHKKLNGAVALVALQKNRGVDTGLGGFRGLEKPRLYLAMDSGTLKIIKAKNWQGKENPNGKQVNFKIRNGCDFIQTRGWHYPTD